ncbi:histone-lysine N-methyltransferase eggless-like [Tropilaelaps mercedesae]|uniref:Histone-lysine N-methyltransferase eggless-like n=1 Tax=Tropilaelaps mercedesae TaxID=418985 RepID=A0A1V9X194_9ACAR|nr:histone-lysine N-methyltransferase eggless-like [Tropilaelaps mercedesae]
MDFTVELLPLAREKMWDPVEGERAMQGTAECAVINCDNTMKKNPDLKFYLFPVDAGERVVWSCLLGRTQGSDNGPWMPTAGATVCQKHFIGERRLKMPQSDQYYPSIFPTIRQSDCTPTSSKRARGPRLAGYYVHRTTKTDQRRTSILVQKSELPEPDPELDGLTCDELEDIMYELVYKPVVTKMHEMAAGMKTEFIERMRGLNNISRKIDAARVHLEHETRRLAGRNQDLLARTAYTHTGSLTPGGKAAAATGANLTSTSGAGAAQTATRGGMPGTAGASPAQAYQQQRMARKPMFDVRMPSIVKDTRFTKLTPLKINQKVFVLEGRKTDAWGRGVVTQVVDYERDCVSVRVDGAVREKSFTLGQVAYSSPHNAQLQLGSRIVSQYVPDKQFYAGVVIEYPKWQNRHRYLILFEDGYWQYSQPSNMYLICKQTSMPWAHVNQPIVPFIRKHFITTEHALLRASVGQLVQAEREKQFFEAKMAVDGNLLKLAFRHYGDTFATEWLYAGSHRLKDVFEHLTQTNRSKHKIARRKTGKKGQPYLEFADDTTDVIELSDDEDDEGEQESAAEGYDNETGSGGAPRRNTARKSTAGSQATSSGVCRTPKVTAKVDLGLQGAVERVKLQPVHCQVPFVVHNCSRLCIYSDDDPLKFTSLSPYVMPYFVGWTRHEGRLRKRSVVLYRAPCGRMMRNSRDVMDYLIMTESKLTVDQFCFEPAFDAFAVWKPSITNYFEEDITRGAELYPISHVNGVDNRDDRGFVPYWAERRPTEAVKKVMHMDAEFLPCCSCEDDCLDRNVCECQRQSVNMSDAQGVLNRQAGYTFRSLTDPLVTGLFECNARCACSKRCINRVAQNGIQLRLQLFKTERKGYGVRTLHDIPRGRFICTYAGTILTDIEADESGQDTYFAELDYIDNVVKHKEGYESAAEDLEDIDDDDDELGLEASAGTAPAGGDGKKKLDADGLRQLYYGKEESYVMDALTGGNIGRYFNHCCEPNMFVQNVFVDTHDLRFPWVAFFAERTIKAGEELTWDYMYEVGSVPGKRLPCYCGVPTCRKRLL